MILSQNIKNLILDKREKRIIHHRRVAEIDKINDPRRVKIAEMVQLSKEQKEAIDEVYMKNYGSKIPYIWHQYYTAYTGNFDPYYVPELLYIPEFERFMNNFEYEVDIDGELEKLEENEEILVKTKEYEDLKNTKINTSTLPNNFVINSVYPQDKNRKMINYG